MTTHPSSIDLLPQPFAWIDIPAGSVTIDRGGYATDQGKTFEVGPFTIAKYPVTNAQFAGFMAANGYDQPQWWPPLGWQLRQDETWTAPRLWYDQKWNQPDYPVVGVTWFEAVAFCHWLSDATAEPIRLPTETEWQHAAQGDSNRAYPWGDTFDVARSNTSVKIPSKKNSTSPVTRYEGLGDSPFGVVDMSGNVWEWCSTNFTTGRDDLMLDETNAHVTMHGGAWYMNNRLDIRFRGGFAPHVTDHGTGFRIARTLA